MDAPNQSWTVRELVAWWSASGFAQRIFSRAHVERRLRQHVLPQLGDLRCSKLYADRLELHLADLAHGGLGPESLNKIRSDLRRCIRAAKGSRRWPWDDPTDFVKPYRVPRRMWRTLTVAEARALLWGAPLSLLALFAVAIYAGLRKGEIIGLRREDVDLAGRRIFVRRSGHRETTKNGRQRVVPISDELERYLRRQLAWWEGRSEWVFPGASGGMRHVDASLGRAMRHALQRGGVHVAGVRFHDLRHTCSTLLRRARVEHDMRGAMLGHLSSSQTDDYTHFEFEDLLAAANRLVLGAPSTATQGGSMKRITWSMLLLVVALAGCGASALPELVDAGQDAGSELDAGPACPCSAGEHLDPATRTCVPGTGPDACDGGAR